MRCMVQYAQRGILDMSRDGDSGSMASRRRVWYYRNRQRRMDAEAEGNQAERDTQEPGYRKMASIDKMRHPEAI